MLKPSKKVELRPHQELAISMLRDSIKKGFNRPILGAPCSFGKTITAGYLMNEVWKRGKRGLFICDRIKLVQQSLESFDRMGLDVGVIQGSHERTDWSKPIQIASIQTLARKKNIPHADLVIVDECHVTHKSLQRLMERWGKIPFIGLSATPYSKGLGKIWNDLVIPITPEQLLDQGFLCPVDYYGSKQIDLTGVKSKAIKTGGSDYDPESLAEAVEKQAPVLNGEIVKNWVEKASGRQTIAFCPSIRHSKWLVEEFRKAGIGAYHIDGYTPDDVRHELFEAHDKGEFMILSCSQLLSTGYDSPTTSCIIDCKPTKSLITYIQTAGRIMRTAEGKERAIYLDHAGNVRRHGFAESIVPDELDDGTKKFNERQQTKEKKEPEVRQCPKCFGEMMGMRCKCGYEILRSSTLLQTKENLEKMKKEAKRISQEEKQLFYLELLKYAKDKGRKKGWAYYTYKDKFGVFPPNSSNTNPELVSDIRKETLNFIRHKNIKFIKSNGRADNRNAGHRR